ncbi:MAG: hypothetical protein MMC33_010444 [Icmadophila ericetorum]|nr:hypothetical protein [Icmadophila ericetorum]
MDNRIPSPAIAIPPRKSLRFAAQNQSQRRSTSSVNRVKIQPASPEVISSLISSFSAISPSLDRTFDELPVNCSPRKSRSPSRRFSGFDGGQNSYKIGPLDARYGIDYGRKNDLPWMNEVVRSRSQEPAPRSFLEPSLSVPASTTRLPPRVHYQDQLFLDIEKTRFGDNEQPCSIGTPKIQPRPLSPALSVKSTASADHGRLRPRRSLLFRTSRESMRKSDGEQKHKASGEKQSKVKSQKRRSEDGNRRLTLVDPYTTETAVRPESISSPPLIPLRASSARTSRDKASLLGAGEQDLLVAGKRVPSRNASLRHSTSSSLTEAKAKSADTEQKEIGENKDTIAEADDGTQQAELTVPDDPREDKVNEVDEVSRRIEELRAQKESRNRQRASETPSPLVSKLIPKIASQQNQANPEDGVMSGKPKLDQRRGNLEDRTPGASRQESHFASKDSALTATECSQNTSTPAIMVLPTNEATFRGNRRSISRQSRRISINSPETHKRAFSNPLSQVIRQSQYGERPSTADSIDEAVNRYLSSPRLSQRIRHPDTGRIIAFSEVGDTKGSVIFCCVGMGLTRYLTAFYDELATTLRLRMITPDRPGIGDSEAYLDGSDTPLGWADDVLAICQHLNIARFSLLAHSAGAIYALATALRMPQYIRGRIHLLAPWIPPSQMSAMGSQQESLPASALPYSQRILRSLPTTFLKAANSSFLSTTSASLSPKSPRRTKRKSFSNQENFDALGNGTPTKNGGRLGSLSPSPPKSMNLFTSRDLDESVLTPKLSEILVQVDLEALKKERRTDYDARLTDAIWEHATTNANPAVDLLVCLERRQPIGFRYVDINKAVVIHHGTKDARVPIDNVKWLGKTMRRCEVRALEGHEHGLMASAAVMGNVLMEMAKEWDDWNRVVQGKKTAQKRHGAK